MRGRTRPRDTPMPESPNPHAGSNPSRARRGRLAATAALAAGAAGLGWGVLGPGGAAAAGVAPPALAATAGGGLVLGGLAAWLLRSGRVAALVAESVADFAQGRTPTELLRITRTAAGPAADWNRLLDRIEASAAGGNGDGSRASSPAAPRPEADPLSPAFEAVPHGLLVLGPDGRVERANGAAARLLRVDPDALPGRDLDALLGDDDLAGRAFAVAAGVERRGGSAEVAAGGGEDGENGSVLRVTLRPLRCAVRGAAAGSGGGGGGRASMAGALVLLEDVTQQRCADRARDLFVAQASHELRAPLTNMQLHAERAIDLGTAAGAEAAGERADCLNRINDEVLRLARLIDEVLSVSQIKAGSLSAARDDVDPGELLGRVAGDHRPAAARRGQTLTLDAEPKLPVLQGDREKLSMLLHNLVGNAVKYGRRGGATVVRAAVSGGFLEVRVIDDGPGILPEEREKVFEAFFRGTHDAGEGEERPEGTGLGLPLAAEVAALHQGTLEVTDGEGGRGSCFLLRLPVRAGSAADRVSPSGASGGGGGPIPMTPAADPEAAPARQAA